MQKPRIIAALILNSLSLISLLGCSDAAIVDVRVTAPQTVTANSLARITGYANPEPGLSRQNTALTWSIRSGLGTLTDTSANSVVYAAPNLSTSSVVVIRATSVANTNRFQDINITITP
jgi:hypothetical protein